MAPTLEIEAIEAGYGRAPVIHDLSLAVRAGEWLVLLGANGCGKSTLLRAATGQIPLRRGRVRICGADVATARIAALGRCGVAVDPGALPAALTGRQYLEMVASIRGCAPDSWPEPGLHETLAFGRFLDTRLGACSLGTRAKFAIAAALLGSPRLLVLDESLNGLDPVASLRVRQVLGRVVSDGGSVLLATHQVDTLASIGTRAVFMEDGRIAHAWMHDVLTQARAEPNGLERMVVAALLG